MNILFEGWINIPHSYAIVLCNQLIGLHKRGKYNLYVSEQEYFFEKWNNIKKSYRTYYNQENSDILEKIVSNDTNGVEFDLIYRITYPYNIDNVPKAIPKCIFYTAEFSKLTQDYFKGGELANIVEDENMYFTGPSKWSTNGLKQLNIPYHRNRVITHGVDPTVFYKDEQGRNVYRNAMGFKEDDIVLLNMGAFTSNKGIVSLIQLIHKLVIKENMKNVRMVLKGINELYESEKMFYVYLHELRDIINETDLRYLIENKYLQFTFQTFTFNELRCVYNMCDLYISPYLAEGFNITPLEALCCGTHVMVPETGSTKEYIEDIFQKSPEYIHYIPSEVIEDAEEKCMNNIQFYDLCEKVTSFVENIEKHRSANNKESYETIHTFIKNNYSWEVVADLLDDYFTFITNNKIAK